MTEERIAEALVEHAPGIILDECGSLNSCILSTRVAIDVLGYFGVMAAPKLVQVIVGNRPFADRVLAEGLNFRVGDEWWLATGAHSVGLGFPASPRPGGWPGHVVALTPGHMIDLSIAQARRPDQNVLISPLCFPAGPAWLAGEHLIAQNEKGTIVVYMARPDHEDQRFRAAPDWRRLSNRSRIVGKVIRAMKESGIMPTR